MKHICIFFAILFIIAAGTGLLLAQEDDDDNFPFISDEDEAALEVTLPEDVPDVLRQSPLEAPKDTPQQESARPLYNLLILDRAACPSSDIGSAQGIDMLYKFKHGTNGYLIALYTTTGAAPVFPDIPSGSYIVAHMMSAHTGTMRSYVQSGAFKRHVTHSTVTAEILRAF